MSKFSIKTAAIAAVVGGVLAGASSASAALQLPTSNCSYSFNTNLKSGSTGVDVMNLQKVLNMYPQTRVAATGAGSPGMETTKFGPATKAAVNKFQALHLADLGITAPTGNVFSGTRGLLNQICVGGSTSTGSTGTTGSTGSVVNGPVSVMLSASQPTGQLVAGQSGAVLANLTFTGNGTVTNIELQRVGVSTDSTLTNVYLYDGNTRITDAASVVTGGYVRFNAGSGLFSVNGTRTITVRADLSSLAGGNAVGVKLNSVTALGSSASTFTNVQGNILTVASNVTTASVNFQSLDQSAKTVDAGTSNFNVWSGTASVGTRDVLFRAATFKFVGSAPVDSVANLSLYVDGAKIAGPSMINALNNNKVTFDLGSSPYLLRTGSHTIDLRGDIVKGSNRTLTFSVENVADLMFEDRDLTGVNVSASVNNNTLTTGNSAYGQITVNKGTVTVNVDPSFVASRVTGGATNMTISSFTMKAYGEDVKVNNLQVTPVLGGSPAPYAGGLVNVGLYLNGGQIGSSQNWSSGALTYNLGSSLIIPAGQTVTVSVKADIKNATSSTSYTGGTVYATVGGVQYNAQGQSSSELTSVAYTPVNGNALSISSGTGNFAKTSGFTDRTVAPNTAAVKVGSFTLQAGSAEDTVVNGATIYATTTGFTLSNLSNLTLKSGDTTLGTPIGNVNATNAISFSDVVVPMNATKTFDVYADVGGASTGSTTVSLALSTRGPVSGTTATVGGSSNGVVTTAILAALGTPTKVSSSAVSQYVVGSSNMTIATYKLVTSSGDATVRELDFALTGTDSVESVTVNGVTANFVSSTARLTGLSIPVSTTGTDVPVTVKYAGFKNATVNGSLTAGVNPVSVALTYAEATSGNGALTTFSGSVSSSNMKLYASKPTVTLPATSGTLTAGTVKIGQFTVTADTNGGIAVATTSLVTSWSTSGATTVTNIHLRESGNSTAISNTFASATSGTAYQLGFTTPYTLSAGQSKTFEVWGTIGTAGFGQSAQVATQLDQTQTTFKWSDTVTATSNLDGSGILNWPSEAYQLKN